MAYIELIKDYIDKYFKNFNSIIPYKEFDDLALFIRQKCPDVKKEVIEKTILDHLKPRTLGPQDRGYGIKTRDSGEVYQGQDEVQNFSKHDPGELAEPKAAKNPLSAIELKSEKDLPVVRVKDNPNPPWGASYAGVIEKANPNGTFNIRDLSTGVLYMEQPANLIEGNPFAFARPEAPPQNSRHGDPEGFLDSPGDVGDPNATREYPGLYHRPKGTENMDVKNPKSVYDLRKQAASISSIEIEAGYKQLYSFFLRKVVLLFGEETAKEVDLYIKGELKDPPKKIRNVLRQYGVDMDMA